ncbi:hypothetical protein [Bacteroides sp. 519]|uniref:hypothetical protein n=1 Tax=Bacteroides sp. 519 TaxID=2302937 RepID=UPI0013D78ADE|nr:hypothetical protein [Bacteroides sp. 519]NDV56672.1 hypothetical protein [Bacteroides sp. 519]
MKQEATKYLQEYIDRMQAKGITPTMEDLNQKMGEFFRTQNNTPRTDFEGYSSLEMHKILHFTFDADSPICFNPLSSHEYSQIPILRQVKRFAEIISQNGQIKLTTAGYLPIKIVQELYPLGAPDEMIENAISKLGKEMDCTPVHLARLLAEASGIIKKRKGILSLTATGTKIIADDSKLFDSIFKGFCQKFNWHYFDNYSDDVQSGTIGQLGFGFSLILLSIYGNTERSERYYAEKYFKAFPMLLETVQPTYGTVLDYCFNCYCLRTFERFLYHFGLVEIKKGKRILQEETYIQKTLLFDRLISLMPHREFEMKY